VLVLANVRFTETYDVVSVESFQDRIDRVLSNQIDIPTLPTDHNRRHET
jgi:hypothetical protein